MPASLKRTAHPKRTRNTLHSARTARKAVPYFLNSCLKLPGKKEKGANCNKKDLPQLQKNGSLNKIYLVMICFWKFAEGFFFSKVLAVGYFRFFFLRKMGTSALSPSFFISLSSILFSYIPLPFLLSIFEEKKPQSLLVSTFPFVFTEDSPPFSGRSVDFAPLPHPPPTNHPAKTSTLPE